jgi:hypothetical protein
MKDELLASFFWEDTLPHKVRHEKGVRDANTMFQIITISTDNTPLLSSCLSKYHTSSPFRSFPLLDHTFG